MSQDTTDPNDPNTQRGLVIISALLNFADWLSDTPLYPFTIEKSFRGKLVKEFLESHSDEKNYFLQAEDIAKRLGVPFKKR